MNKEDRLDTKLRTLYYHDPDEVGEDAFKHLGDDEVADVKKIIRELEQGMVDMLLEQHKKIFYYSLLFGEPKDPQIYDLAFKEYNERGPIREDFQQFFEQARRASGIKESKNLYDPYGIANKH